MLCTGSTLSGADSTCNVIVPWSNGTHWGGRLPALNKIFARLLTPVLAILVLAMPVRHVDAQSGASEQSQTQSPQQGNYRILETIDHDDTWFTQGLEVSDGLMYESSGLYGKSKLRIYRTDNDDTLQEVRLPERFFAEGLTLLDNELFVLTWKENTLLVVNPDNLQTKRELSYKGEGWGLANNGSQLIMSDGSDTIYFRNPESFAVERTISVRSQQHSVQRINELEFAEGYLWANIWFAPVIVKIDPTNGQVVSYYDFSQLLRQHSSGSDNRVLNGIAYDSTAKAYWITGKLWPKRYLVKLD